jgi:hypothetical protein
VAKERESNVVESPPDLKPEPKLPVAARTIPLNSEGRKRCKPVFTRAACGWKDVSDDAHCAVHFENGCGEVVESSNFP